MEKTGKLEELLIHKTFIDQPISNLSNDFELVNASSTFKCF